MTWGLTAVAGATLVSGAMSSSAAKSAARTQAQAANRAMAQEREMFDIGREDLAPYRETGYTALRDIESLRPMITAQFGPDQMAQYLDPSMEFRRRLGEQTTARMLNVGGGALSGNTLRGLEEFGQNLASTEFGNAFNRFQTERGNIYNTLANIAGMGQQSVNTGVQAGQNLAAQQTGLLTGQAAAQAAGQVGAANAMGGAIQGLGNQYYLSQLMRPPTSAAVANYSLSGGAPAAPGMGGGTGLTYSPTMANQFFSAK
jgi:hypothetical protein